MIFFPEQIMRRKFVSFHRTLWIVRVFLGFLIFFFSFFPLHAELIVFSDQSTMEGTLIEQNKDFIVIKSEGQNYVIRRKLIENILNDADAKAYLKQQEIQKKKEQRQKKIKEQAERELKKAASEAKSSASMVKNFYYNPGWMLAKSAVLPGWGQSDAGMASGTVLVSSTLAAGGVLFYLNGRAKKEKEIYENRVVSNTLITLLPGPYTIPQRLALGYALNGQLGGPCGPQQRNFNYGQISFGVFYAAQLVHLGWTIGSAALFAGRSESGKKIIFAISNYSSQATGKPELALSLQYRF